MRGQSELQTELKQTQPFRSAAEEAAVAILRTADVLRRRMTAAIEPEGITPQQYNVLRILRGARGEPMPTLEIAGRLIEQTPGITRLLDRLEVKGLVRRQRCPEDRRLVHCWITEAGMVLLSRLDASLEELDASVTQGLGEADVARLIDALARVRREA